MSPILLASVLACSPAKPTPTLDPGALQVTVLGSGTPVPDPTRSGPALVVTFGGRAFVVDAGPGIVRQAAAAAVTQPALNPINLDRVFLTHLHSDHTAGLPDLWLTPWVVGRDAPLHVHGPPGTASMTEHLIAAWSEDLRVRSQGTEQRDPSGARLIAHEIVRSGPAFVSDDLRVDAIAVPHGTWSHAYGYRFEANGQVIVISGDTAASDAIVEACNGCDVLVHEVYSDIGYQAIRRPGQREYHPTFHTSATELADLAARAKPKKLVLVHQLHFGSPDAILVQEVAQRWDGPVFSAADLDVFSAK